MGDEVIDIGLGLALKLFGDIGLALDADAEDIGQSFRGPDLAGDGFFGVIGIHHGEIPKAVDDVSAANGDLFAKGPSSFFSYSVLFHSDSLSYWFELHEFVTCVDRVFVASSGSSRHGTPLPAGNELELLFGEYSGFFDTTVGH